MSVRVGLAAKAPTFQKAAPGFINDPQIRHNVRHATDTIRKKRDFVVGEVPDWESLRVAGEQIKAHTLRHLAHYLQAFEAKFTAAGGHVHWARDADEANRIILDIYRSHGAREIVKVKSMTSDETQLNESLIPAGIAVQETDLADMILQLSHDRPSHIVVPALHVNRAQVRETFRREMHLDELGSEPADLTEAARRYLRERFLRAKFGFSGANFAVAETGSLCVVESEGNGRMCLTLPEVLVSLVGIEKVVPTFRDLEVFLQLLPRSATGERMNPYTSLWNGPQPGDGPQEMHVVLLDNGRTRVLADPEARQTLHCIRCGACLNVCPVYRQTGGQAYGSTYPGPIGAILSPQLQAMKHSQSLPYASSLCGACFEACPVRINIPEVLVHLRGKVVREEQSALLGKVAPENLAMQAALFIFSDAARLEAAQRAGRLAQKPLEHNGVIEHLPPPLGGWSSVRDLMPIPQRSFREWWRERRDGQTARDGKAPRG